jgi:hypothetical protein
MQHSSDSILKGPTFFLTAFLSPAYKDLPAGLFLKCFDNSKDLQECDCPLF